MGSPIRGTDNFFDQFLFSRLAKVTAAQDSIAILEDPQVELHSLRSCLGSCKIIHLLRTVPFCILHSFLEQFDSNLKSCLSRIIQCSLPNDSWCQATLPFRLGVWACPHPFLPLLRPFWVHVIVFVSWLFIFYPRTYDLVFPNEEHTVATFERFTSDIFIPSATQQDLQALLDQNQYDQLFASFNIRNRARFTALSHSSGTSSRWLNAIPQVSLTLAIPGPEIVVGLRLWLGIPLFPLSPLCVCLTSNDQFGDHLQECSHGSMRIRRHDALVDIVCHALSQSHSGVLKEQRVSYEDNSRPGDVYHPDFQHGRPAYFDVSVRSTTQPSHISFSSSCAGVAAAAGELAKDQRHQDAVEEAGCDLVPLVVETFGFWSPFALQTLRTIAERTTARSGASTKQVGFPLKIGRYFILLFLEIFIQIYL